MDGTSNASRPQEAVNESEIIAAATQKIEGSRGFDRRGERSHGDDSDNLQATVRNINSGSRLLIDSIEFSFKSGQRPACLVDLPSKLVAADPPQPGEEPQFGTVFLD